MTTSVYCMVSTEFKASRGKQRLPPSGGLPLPVGYTQTISLNTTSGCRLSSKVREWISPPLELWMLKTIEHFSKTPSPVPVTV